MLVYEEIKRFLLEGKNIQEQVCVFLYILVVAILNLGGDTHNKVIIQMCYVKDSWWTICIKYHIMILWCDSPHKGIKGLLRGDSCIKECSWWR